MVSDLEKRLDNAPHPKQFYRAMAERALEASVGARLTDQDLDYKSADEVGSEFAVHLGDEHSKFTI